ncbi:acyl-CoA dehydrogenase family protein [Sphingomonas immobilis]|uniref:Acyl-CoA dehydrogenase family protein n=1 Tax=Sphingomonas immobilis TaxID=3063997 RepID=A0ABT8ZZV9_9SPHN|nr:acyl-CoA dehydrogenase family protein [Sphingomonas sp. CA1-15]MDO7843119.1 acyl-CoA dehydrogenase family protein [Sphingomonas sp. CA1-15]
MDFSLSQTQVHWRDRVKAFMDAHVFPNEERYEREVEEGARWKELPLVEELKAKAKAQGLWNLFMPPLQGHAPLNPDFRFESPGLTNLEYALCAEEMGKVKWASELFNCSPPDTGNMEVLTRYANADQQAAWLKPLMDGEIRSTFLMTEPAVASSDATNIETSIVRDGDDYVVDGRKWWSSGMGDPRVKIAIVMGKTDPGAAAHAQQSMILVPADAPGLTVEKMLTVFGYDHAPEGHGQVLLDKVRVPAGNMLLGEGRGFEIAQGRLGPGRIHHAMRSIGASERALEEMVRRLMTRVAFGKRIHEHSVWEERVAQARIDIEMTRLLCLKAADLMDREGNRAARTEIAMIKVAAPNTAVRVIDNAIQAFGGGGVSQVSHLAASYASQRTLRLADGPDEVHRRTIAKLEFRKYRDLIAE